MRLTQVYKDAGYHHENSNGEKGRSPKNGQEMLNKSIIFKATTPARTAVDTANDEIVLLYETGKGTNVFHGFIESWGGLTEQMKTALIRAGLVTKKGKIIK